MRFNEEMDKYAHHLAANRPFFKDCKKGATKKILPIIHDIMDEQLTEKQKFCVDMYYFRNCNSSQIAKILGTSRANVTKHIRRGLTRMEKSMRCLLLVSDDD
ncbi:MAG: sigma-70 family RNA polymerase sigma factor [Clostridia bacterium]|nr:sigma-70 family RNA polymerase sigma factor [Clostridia bacterium]